MNESEVREALLDLYKWACHHARCERSEEPHTCSCGVSAALERARLALGLKDHTKTTAWGD